MSRGRGRSILMILLIVPGEEVKTMQIKIRKLSAIARAVARYTQESASPKLNVSPRSISAYECGKAPIPDDVVLKMIDIYNALWLGYMYLKITNKVGTLILPNISIGHYPLIFWDLQVEMEQVSKMQMDLANVGRDDRIPDDKHMHRVTYIIV
jgi:hypothetical protein